ncbi:phage tail protein [Ectopseudomonas mendocina]|uniref:phage tail protein n=1 Tax=Ectopseudomonas mendocina TaxID=300 RepID=UPI00376F19D2
MSTPYINSSGQFLGWYGEGARLPEGAIAVEEGPEHADQRWLFPGWSMDWLAEALCKEVDLAADDARTQVVGHAGRTVEYEAAAEDAKAFKENGYPTDAVPGTVAAGMVGGISARQAADDILREAQQYKDALLRLREVRLAAKYQIRQLVAAGEASDARAYASRTIETIKAAVAGVGNARG